MDKEYSQAILEPRNIVITNPDLDRKYIESLAEELRSGKITPENLDLPLVRVEAGQGYFAADGNNKLTAFQLAGITSVRVNLYSLNRPVSVL